MAHENDLVVFCARDEVEKYFHKFVAKKFLYLTVMVNSD